MDKTADALKDLAKTELNEAGRSTARAGTHAAEAASHLAGAAANAVFATAKVVEGVALNAEAGVHLANAGMFAGVGGAAWVSEEVRSGGRYVAKNASSGFAKIANFFSRIIGDGKTVTVRELEGDPNAKRFSDKMFDKAGKQLVLSSEAAGLAWNSYIQAVSHMAGAATNVAFAAGHTAAVAGNLAAAAAHTGSAAVVKMSEYGVRLGSVAVQAAEQGMVGAREMAILSAKFSAGVANILANPDQGKVEVLVQNRLNEFNAELKALAQKNPQLSQLTAQVQNG
ncbi:MAG: hypothetical protein HYZ28_19655 [Myxococcales bacterium]|nr:hypothetical protein [Myxococcales bacterium]